MKPVKRSKTVLKSNDGFTAQHLLPISNRLKRNEKIRTANFPLALPTMREFYDYNRKKMYSYQILSDDLDSFIW